jgi:sulfite exporter TauE/SafE
MDGWALVAAAGLMGVAGLPHCAAMCAAPCAAVAGRGPAGQPLFQAARLLGYGAAGAVAAAGVGALREGLSFSPALRPLWTLLHLAALAFGLWMLARGRWPEWLARRNATPPALAEGGWQRMIAPARSAGAGALWIAWPCALSQSALLVAALGDTPWQGAAAMAAFALASSPALWLGPALWQRWRVAVPGREAAAALRAEWPVRLAGALIAAGSAWALGHGLWMRFIAWCTG